MASPIPLHPGKSFRPPLPADHLPRPLLVQTLKESSHRRLVLISAPAGFGKSTLVAEYCENLPAGWQSVWVALDSRDHQAGQLLRTLIYALRTLFPRLGEPQLALLEQTHPSQALDLEPVTLALLESLAERHEQAGRASPAHVVLVLDDYHLVQGQQCDRLCALLLERLPSNYQLILTSRQKPDWHLARLRLANQLVELGEQQLRLDDQSAASFLRRVGVMEPDPEWARHLLQRNEGWFAGLRLMAIAAEQASGRARPLTLPKLPGPLINEYLFEEVVSRQPPETQAFLHDVAWLDRFNAVLADRVRERGDSASIIQRLARGRVFIVPLDEQGDWHRFHHLFRDVLRARSAAQDPSRSLAVHRRACQWFSAQGFIAEAIEQALAAERPDQAASLVQALPLDRLLAEQPVAKLLRWKAELPVVLQASSARLVLVQSWTLALACQLEEAQVMSDRLTYFLPQPDAASQRALLAQAQALQGYLARQAGNLDQAAQCCSQALQALGDESPGSRLTCMLTLAEVDLAQRRIESARAWTRSAIELAQRAGQPLFEAQAQLMRARLQQARGLVKRARQTIQAQHLALERIGHVEPLSARARLTMYEGYLAGLQGEREQALTLLDVGIDEARQCRDVHVLLGYCIKASLLGRQADSLTHAFDTLTEAERLMHMWDIPPVFYLGWVTALKCDLWMSTGRRELAEQWLPRLRQTYSGTDPAAPPPFYHALGVFIELVSARLFWLGGDQRACEQILRALLAELQHSGELLQTTQVQVHLARLLFHSGRDAEAAVLLRAALAAAAPNDYLGAFLPLVKQSPPGLPAALSGAPASVLRDRLLAMIPALPRADGRAEAASLREPLSSRERDVLRCIAQGYSNQQISETLYISLHTVKSHARRINHKLGVARRTQAVAQAKLLGLLD